MSLIDELNKIVESSASYDEKFSMLTEIVTPHEARALLERTIEVPVLKDRLTGSKRLFLSIQAVFFNEIRKGIKKDEWRDYNDYYKEKCTYVENGKRYLVPFTEIVFFVGRGSNAKRMVVKVRDITCNGTYLIFHLGQILSVNVSD